MGEWQRQLARAVSYPHTEAMIIITITMGATIAANFSACRVLHPLQMPLRCMASPGFTSTTKLLPQRVQVDW